MGEGNTTRRSWQARKSYNHGQRRLKGTPTKAEQAVREFFEGGGWKILTEATNLFPLPGGGNYTPDILAWKEEVSGVLVIEVKGGYRGPGWEQGYEKYKRTAREYDGNAWHFILATVEPKTREISVEVWAAEDGTNREG